MIELGPLKQSYQERIVLNIPSLQLQEDGRYALLGVNGAGKSTLLRLMLATLAPGRPAGDIACLPQRPYAFAVSVAQNIAMGIPEHLHLSKSEVQARVDRQIEQFGLTALAGKRGDRLSGGESQRMALARLLVVPRRIILLDEPANHMDLQGLASLETVLIEYLDTTNCLLVLATHQISLARLMTREILFLDQGQLLFRGASSFLSTQTGQPQLDLFLRYHPDVPVT